MAYTSEFERREDEKISGTNKIEETEGRAEPLTKRRLKESLESIPHMKQFEEYVGVEAKNFDEFVLVLFALKTVEIGSQTLAKRVSEALSSKRKKGRISPEIGDAITEKFDVLSSQILSEVKRNVASKSVLYDRWGRKLITEMWDHGNGELGLDFGTMWEEYDLTDLDIIGESSLYKKAVVNYCMKNIADSVANVLTDWNRETPPGLEDLLGLPEE